MKIKDFSLKSITLSTKKGNIFKTLKIKPNGSDDCVNGEVNNITNIFIKYKNRKDDVLFLILIVM